MSKKALMLIGVLLIGVAIMYSLKPWDSAAPSKALGPVLQPGDQPPDFTLPDMTGTPWTLSAHTGKVVLVKFWATWCPPCADEMPLVDRMAQEIASDDFVILPVSVDQDGAAAVQRFYGGKLPSHPVLLDPQGEIMRRYGVFRLPESFLIDRHGTLVKKQIGAHDWMAPQSLQSIRFLLGG